MKFLVLLLLALILGGCVSTAYLTIKFRAGYGGNDLVKVENILEGAGLSRGHVMQYGKLAPRNVQNANLSSIFYSEAIHGFQADVSLDKTGGVLSYRIYQIGVRKFEESAGQSASRITGQSRKIFGENITITREAKTGPYFL
jgi:hypothetical protein